MNKRRFHATGTRDIEANLGSSSRRRTATPWRFVLASPDPFLYGDCHDRIREQAASDWHGHWNDVIQRKRRAEERERIESEDLQRWLAKSEVVDENGAPRMVYHGGTFDPQKDENPDIPHKGFFFTNSLETAKWHSWPIGKIIRAYLRIENPFSPLDHMHVGALWVREWIHFWRREETIEDVQSGWVDRATGEDMNDCQVMDMIADGRLPDYDGSPSNERWHDFLATARMHHDGYIGPDPTERSMDMTETPEIYVVFEAEQIRCIRERE